MRRLVIPGAVLLVMLHGCTESERAKLDADMKQRNYRNQLSEQRGYETNWDGSNAGLLDKRIADRLDTIDKRLAAIEKRGSDGL
jgi:hypothetical protein